MVIPESCAQINLKFTGTSVPLGAEMTFGVGRTGFETPEEVKDAVMDAVSTSTIITLCTGATKLTSVLVKLGPNATGAMAEFPAGLSGVGASDTLPPNVALLIRKGTPQGGRRAQGRMFLPGIPEAATAHGGIVDPGYLSDAQSRFATLRAELIENTVPMVLLHSQDFGGLGALPVTTLTVQPQLATQRRRLR